MSVHRLAKYQVDDPFTRVPNQAIRDPNLDLKAIGLLVVMLAKPDGWKFTERNLASEIGVGRAQLRTAMATLIDAGYVARRHEFDGDRPILVTEVYDCAQGPETGPAANDGDPARVRFPDRPETEGSETEPHRNNGLVETTERPATTERDVPSSKAAADGWDDAAKLCDYLAQAIAESGGCKPPNVTRAWVTEMEKLVRIDEHTPDEVRRAIDWTHRADPSSNGAWWQDKVLSPQALRRHYPKLQRQARREHATTNGHGRVDRLEQAAAELERAGL